MKAHELLSSPDKWTIHVAARDNKGRQVCLDNEAACCFCIWGSIRKCYNPNDEIDLKYTVAIEAERIIKHLKLTSFKDLFEWNDNTTYERVYSVLKELDI